VTAVVQRSAGSSVTDDELSAHCREKLAAYKAPRTFVFVDAVQRSPVGKADYAWAKETAKKVVS
jgi:acyl-CoA synthetase (AMP-forming)/AMP-acid ligase II